jgi:hypothetical protein
MHMNARSMWRRALAGATITLAATAIVTQSAAAAQQVASTCPAGFVCLTPTNSPEPTRVLIKQGDSRSFPGGLKVSAVSNQTKLNYCVSASPFNYNLVPGREIVLDHTVLRVAPAAFCLA